MTAVATAQAPGRQIHLIQGECRVTSDAGVMLTTVLGSCVAACIRDPVAQVGGMNHFLLPENDASEGLVSLRYGAFAMELLVNGLIRLGARRERMEAKLFGGARLSDGLPDMGANNASFAQEFLDRERIRHKGGSLRGDYARRIQFWPVSGRVRQLTLARGEALHFARAPEAARDDDGTVEFFAARPDRLA